ncbi:hypothetical protein [Rhodococcus sp. IEGM 1330]|uniref:hypothetical protein n=1 Tax=Rhodococcus sp. IEGM 1330 TaxID=3082225 RepID=UPI00295515F5|nr:hypothetical protein [Rhodococcus sp. IEGM 1330]MDV8024007.1 hypothetical protein [Rhodococcus sp. IEGM 1330]
MASRAKARRFTYDDLRDLLFTLLGFVPNGSALKQLYKVANDAHIDLSTQTDAIHTAACELLGEVKPPTSAQRNIAAFKKDMTPQLFIAANAPVDCLEGPDRPYWASKDGDQRVFDSGDRVADRTSMSWRSEAVSVPLFATYFGRWHDNGTFETARIMADVRQGVADASPRIGFERHGFKQVDGKAVRVSGEAHYSLSIDEAANLARALLLLVDLATGASDESAVA